MEEVFFSELSSIPLVQLEESPATARRTTSALFARSIPLVQLEESPATAVVASQENPAVAYP